MYYIVREGGREGGRVMKVGLFVVMVFVFFNFFF